MNFYNKFLFFYFLIAFNISADELTINITGQNKEGILNLAIYNNEEAYNRSVKAEGRSEGGFFSGIDSFIELKESHKFIINVPEGIYAIALFIDVNRNMKIDKNFLGIPKEQYGFSNNAMGNLSGPSFEQAKFQVKGNSIQNIKLK
tara:strand:- start:5308 stop:5745 length:438 start_codon:yes stop_codon:yes gene_type:complete